MAAQLSILVPGLAGVLFGSLANAAAYRWPLGHTLLQPSTSMCPSCRETVRPYDNVPVLSYLVLHGRCRDCEAPISPRYPLIEALMGIVWGAVAWQHGLTWLLPALLAFSWVLVVAAAIDLEHRIIPNKLTLRAPPVLLALLALPAATQGAWSDLTRAAVAGIMLPAALLAVSETYRLVRGRAGIGMGDVKLAISIGLVLGYLGWWHVVIWFYASTIGAVLVVVVLLATGRAKLASRIPYGPYLAFGALVAVVFGEPLTAAASAWLLGS